MIVLDLWLIQRLDAEIAQHSLKLKSSIIIRSMTCKIESHDSFKYKFYLENFYFFLKMEMWNND